VIRALLCGPEGFEAELQGTILSRDDVEVRRVLDLEAASALAKDMKPHLVLVDVTIPLAEQLVTALRAEAPTRTASIVGISRGDLLGNDASILEAGANAVLRLPVAPEWDLRLTKLVSIPGRREVRLAVRLKIFGVYGEERIPAMALNMSLTGMLAEAEATLNVGDELGLTFELPTSPVTITGMGRVVRNAGTYRVGVEFVQLDGEAHKELGAFLAGDGGL
jgi:CheY-like chemotaxis protein